MSSPAETVGGGRLVDAGGTAYDRLAMGVVGGSFLAFALAAGTLFGWVPVTGSIAGVPAAALFGAGVSVLGLLAAALGLLSRRGAARTAPDRSTGLGMGCVQALLWGLTAGLVASNTLGLGTLGWLAAPVVGALAGYGTLAAREDIGATLPVAAFALFVGTVVLGGVLSPGWTWEPAAFGAVFPGTLVIPALTMVTGLLTGWTGAAAAAGFGTRGRQNGAFLLIALVVALVLSVLAFLLVFVFERGVGVVLENLSLSTGTLLLSTLAALVLVVRFGHVRPGRQDGPGAVLAFVHLGVAVVLGLVSVLLAGALGTGQSLSGWAVTVEPSPVVGAAPGLVVGVVLLLGLRRVRESWQPSAPRGRLVGRGLGLVAGALAVAALVEVLTWTGLAVGSVPVVPALALAASVFALGMAGLRVGSTTFGTGNAASWTPPLSRAVAIGLGAFVAVCLHVVVTGQPLVAGEIGVVPGGTVDWPFLTNPSQGLGIQIGVMPAMLGTVWIVLGAVLFAVPLAVGSAVFLTEYAEDSLFTQAVDVATNGLWSTPSIVFGLFGLAFLVPRFGGSPSIFAAQLVLGFMLLPLVLITSREAMKSVPDEYRDASAALGVSKWQTVRSVVVPAAMPGVITGVILGVGRIAGETAPLLLVLNGPNFPNAAPGVLSSFTFDVGLQPPFLHVSNPALLERASALPYQLYAVITAGVGAEEPFGWGTALVLLGVVLSFFAISIAARRYFRSKLHQ